MTDSSWSFDTEKGSGDSLHLMHKDHCAYPDVWTRAQSQRGRARSRRVEDQAVPPLAALSFGSRRIATPKVFRM